MFAGVAESADAHVWGACVFDVRVQVPSPAPKKSYHFDTTFFIQTAGLVYHHALACIKLRNDEILARKRDILVFGRMISSHSVSDDIHFLRKWLNLQAFLLLAVKNKSFTLYPFILSGSGVFVFALTNTKCKWFLQKYKSQQTRFWC